MKTQFSFPVILSCALVLSACGKSTPSAPAATATPEPTATAEPSGITLTYGDNAQVELVTPAGRRVYIDVWNPNLLTTQPSSDDVLLITHMHLDHYFDEFERSFPGKKIVMTTGEIEYPDVKITAIVSAHLPGNPLEADKATNFLFLIKTGGLRIVHFGDCGQEAFTGEQLATIGKVDLAVTQLNNTFSLMDATNRMAFHQMEQVKPRLIIPTHYNGDTLEIAAGLWAGFYSKSRTITLLPDALPEKTSLLLMGAEYTVAAYADLYKMTEWK